MAEIRLEQIVKRYDNGFVAVDHADLQIRDGEFLVLVGPSGCGKSTTLRMIAGLEEITSGDLYIGTRRVNDLEPGERDIAMVFQNYALYPHMSVRNNLSFGLRMRKEPKALIDKRVQEAARILSIENLLDRKPRQLSGGQRQRVAVGRAIVRKPAAFLFDEPLSNLDAKLRVQMRTELARLHQKLKTTIVYVTHDQVEAMTLGDRIVVMKDSRIQQIDTPMNLYRQPVNRFVASFIGSPSMNFVKGTLSSGTFATPLRQLTLPLNEQAGDLPAGEYILGFRPEDLTLNSNEPPLTTTAIDVVERMGHECMVYFEVEGHELVARLAGDSSIQPGEQLQFHLTAQAWHLFTIDGSQPTVARGTGM
jgi:multiple sugar transport system ATP-binding protein